MNRRNLILSALACLVPTGAIANIDPAFATITCSKEMMRDCSAVFPGLFDIISSRSLGMYNDGMFMGKQHIYERIIWKFKSKSLPKELYGKDVWFYSIIQEPNKERVIKFWDSTKPMPALEDFEQ
jgi:hypothetical protein